MKSQYKKAVAAWGTGSPEAINLKRQIFDK
jgi:hypothetical protein